MNKRIFVGSISQESNSFSPLQTSYSDFRITRGREMEDILPGVLTMKKAGYAIVPSLCAQALPGGIISLVAYIQLVNELLSYLPLDGSLAGVWLALHGAMDVEFIGSGEAMLASMIRERVGPTVPIAISLDLHANNTYTLAKAVNILCGYRTAPHTDIAETHIRSARLLVQAIEQNILPWCELIRIPIMLTGETVMTASGLGKEIMDSLPVVERAEGVWCASYFAGMPWVDCPQNGSSVVVCGTGNRSPGMAAARNLCDMIWENKGRFTIQDIALAPNEAMDYAFSKTDGPVFVSDTADDVTAGATGDNSCLLDIIVKKGLANVLLAGITDAKAVDACAKAGVGGTISVMLGGSIDRSNSLPVTVGGIVGHLRKNQAGLTDGAILHSKAFDVIILAQREAITCLHDFKVFGLDPAKYKAIIVKLGYLFPELTSISKCTIMALTAGCCSQNLKSLSYFKITKPMYPFDTFDWKSR